MAQIRHTERVSSAQALKASEDRFAVAFYASPIAMAITTADEGRYVDVNEAFVRQMGYTRDEVCGRTTEELHVWPTPDERDAMVAALISHKTFRDQHQQFRTKSGRMITTRYSVGLITLDGVQCILAAIVDVTAQKLAEDALRESEATFRMLTEMTQAGIFIYGANDEFYYLNPQLSRFFGYPAEELSGISIWSLVDPEDRDRVRERAMARRSGRQVSDRYQFKVHTKNGEVRWLDVAAQLIEYRGKPAIMGTGFDITESKRSERLAQESEAKLRSLRDRLTRVQDDERAHIARELHDDLGQRLALLSIQLRQLQKEASDIAPSLKADLRASARLAEEICADTQRISYRLHPTQLAVLGLPKALSRLCAGFARQTTAKIDYAHGDIPTLPPEVSACLYRIAQEAIQNALKHSHSSSITVTMSADEDVIRLSVSDAGRGFDPQAAVHADGLGLVSMEERARSVGGQLSVRSAVSAGTRIEVTIPLSTPVIDSGG